MPKILLCAYSCLKDPDQRFGDGGEGVLGWNMVKQAARFAEVAVLTHYKNKPAIDQKLRQEPLPTASFYYIRLPWGLEILNRIHGGIQLAAYLWQIRAYGIAKRLHAQQKFDLFHHTTYANDWMASFIGALLPVPYVRGPGGGAHVIPSAFLENYSLREICLEKLRSVGQWVFRHDPFFITGQNRAQTILVCNTEAFEALSPEWQKKAHFFPVNGIAQTDIHASLSQEKSPFTCITAGKLLKLKNTDLAIRAFAVFYEKHPGSQFIIIGDGPEYARLEILAKSLGVSQAVQFKKWMAREQLLMEIAAADVFLFASLRDGGGAVVVEAMAQSKPVICFDMAGPGLHVTETSGIKIKPTNPKQAVADMAEAIERLNGDRALREQLGKGALERIKKEYLWDKLGDRLNEYYTSAISDHAT